MNGLTKQNKWNSQVTCGVCGQTMRDDNMKRHMKLHADNNAMNADDKRAELLISLERRKEVHERREQQLQETQAIEIEVGAPAICYEQSNNRQRTR